MGEIPGSLVSSDKHTHTHRKTLSATKVEAHTNDWTWVSGKCLTWPSCKSSGNGVTKTVVQLGEVHSDSAKKMTPHYQIFVTWQQSSPESEKLRWENNGCKLNSQGYGKPKMAILLVLASWQS